MVGLAAKEMDDEAFESFQLDVGQLIVKYKRDTRARKLVNVPPPPPANQAARPPPPPAPPGTQNPSTSGDFQLAVGLAQQQQQQCGVGGYIPDWQHQYQQL